MSGSKFENYAFEPNVKASHNDAFAVVIAHYNDFVTMDLLEGAMAGLNTHGVREDLIEVFDVPGAMELPLAAKWLAETGKFAAIVCLGSVIRGATTHYEVVVNSSSAGVNQVALESGIPVIYGVLTTENIEQAIERSEPRLGNKGLEFAVSAIMMANLKHTITG